MLPRAADDLRTDITVAYSFTITGAPRTKKNHQAIAKNRATGATFIAKDKRLQSWEKQARAQLEMQWGSRPAIAARVHLSAVVYRERNTGDLLNYLAAVSDIIQQHKKKGEILWQGIIVNDVQVASVDGSRLDKDAANPRVEFTLTVLDQVAA